MESLMRIRLVEDPVGFGATEQGRIYIQETRKPVDGIVSFIQDNITNLDAIDAVVSNPEQKARLEEKLAQAGDFYLTSSVDHLIEMAGSRAGKAAALQWLAGELRIAPEEVMVAGTRRTTGICFSMPDTAWRWRTARNP